MSVPALIPVPDLTLTVPAVKCAICSTLHPADADTFITFVGNVNVGATGGVVGNNFDQNGVLKSTTVCCRNYKCFTRLLSPLEIFPPSLR